MLLLLTLAGATTVSDTETVIDNSANISDWLFNGVHLTYNGTGTPTLDTTSAANEFRVLKRFDFFNNTVKNILLDVQDNQTCIGATQNYTGKIWQSSEDQGRLSVCNPGIGGNGIERVAYMRDLNGIGGATYGDTLTGSAASLADGGTTIGQYLQNTDPNGEGSWFVANDDESAVVQCFPIGSNNTAFNAAYGIPASAVLCLYDSAVRSVMGNSFGVYEINVGSGGSPATESQAIFRDNNVSINKPLILGNGSSQVNMTLTSPAGTEYSCGVDNSGTFSCN